MGRLTQYSRKLRKRPTYSEKIFRRVLAHHCSAYNIEFEFQKVFWNEDDKIGYIVDFYVARCHLAFEIDGGYHNIPEQKEKDDKRDEWLRRHGVKVVRLKNETVNNPDSCNKIVFELLKGTKYFQKIKKKKRGEHDKPAQLVKTGKFIDGIEIKEVVGSGKVKKVNPKKPRKKRKCKLEVPGTFAGSILWRT